MNIFNLFKKKQPVNYLEFFLAMKTSPIFKRVLLIYNNSAEIAQFNLN
jgi:hypothetical protein